MALLCEQFDSQLVRFQGQNAECRVMGAPQETETLLETEAKTSRELKIGIALSGGGTRGMVHVGVLKALEENGIEPGIISGTSAGSIVGALYAHGYKPDEIREMAGKQNLLRIMSLKVPNTGFIRHTFLRKLLERHLPGNDFGDCKKPFYVTVANLNTGMAETYNRGPLIDWVIASSSVPVMFEPAEIEGSSYVDGGVLMNLPASPIRHKCDVLIGVNLVPPTEVDHTHVKTMLGIGQRCFDLAALNNIKPELKYCDVVVAPESINDFGRFNFSAMDKMYQIGYDETISRMDEIRRVIGAAVSAFN